MHCLLPGPGYTVPTRGLVVLLPWCWLTLGLPLPASAPHCSCFLGIILRLATEGYRNICGCKLFFSFFEQNMPYELNIRKLSDTELAQGIMRSDNAEE